MTTRRGFIAGMIAAGLAPKPSWADAGSPHYLAAARMPSGEYRLFGLDAAGGAVFDLPLPDRGHAAAAHPHRPEAVAFARRPGTFALVIDCRSGALKDRLQAPEGRHFYGHGAFSADGEVLYTPENDFEAGEGRIGLWQTGSVYTRIGEVSSGGVGPHDAMLMPDGETLVIANGGIETHPDSGRAKLNLPVMQPNLAYMDLSGNLLEVHELDWALHLNSIRHLAVRSDGLVAFAMQWQGDENDAVPLLGLHRRGGTPLLLSAEVGRQRQMNAYAGSVAFSQDGQAVAITSPRGGQAHVFDAAAGDFLAAVPAADICGISAGAGGFIGTTGEGRVLHFAARETAPGTRHDAAWDNHLIALG